MFCFAVSVISITSTDAELQAKILQHNGQTLMTVYTVPADKIGYVTGISFNVGQGKQSLFKGKFRNCDIPNCSFSTKYALDVYQNSFFGEIKVPLEIPPKTDVVITGTLSSLPTVTASASYGLILVDL